MSAALRILYGGFPMSVIDYVATDLFIVRTIKYLATNPDNKWVNSYEFTAVADGTNSDLLLLANQVVNFEAAIHDDGVKFDHVTVSTWVDDHVPYDPTSFLSIPLTQVGTISDITNENVALGMALRVKRNPVSGRFGNLFYRGVLHENQVSAPAGIPILSDAAAIQTLIDDALTSSELDTAVGTLPDGPLLMCMIDATGSVVRRVTSLVAGGVSMIKQDHQWFNRTP